MAQAKTKIRKRLKQLQKTKQEELELYSDWRRCNKCGRLWHRPPHGYYSTQGCSSCGSNDYCCLNIDKK